MKILFISRLRYLPQAGPTYSVPSQISSLSEIEDVLWVNIEQTPCREWEGLPFYMGAKDSVSLRELPGGFSKPDLVVFQCFYHFRPCRIISEIRRNKTPYIIIPRSALTAKAQEKSRFKKILGNALFYKGFAKDALAIQYLTKQELLDSGDGWGPSSVIIPNGISRQKAIKQEFRSDGRRILFIGRYEPYQKGLDVLVEAIKAAGDALRESGVVIILHGSDKLGSAEELRTWIMQAGIDDIVQMEGAAFGEVKHAALLDADCFIMTSRYEGLPMGLLEALSYGLPCVVTPGTNMASEIGCAGAGWACGCDAESVSKALVAFTKADDLDARSANALELASGYEWAAIAKRSAELYRELLKTR